MAKDIGKTETETVEETSDGIKAVVYNDLKESHGVKAYDAYIKIANLMSAGSQGKDHIGADGQPTYPDLDFSGASDEMKGQIKSILSNKEGK